MVPHLKCHKAISMFFPTCSLFQWRILGYLLIWTHAQMPLFGWSQLRVSETDIPTVDHQKMGRVDMIMSWWPKLVPFRDKPCFQTNPSHPISKYTHWLFIHLCLYKPYIYIYIYIIYIYIYIYPSIKHSLVTYIYIQYTYIYIYNYIHYTWHTYPPSSTYHLFSSYFLATSPSFFTSPRLGHFLP